MKDIKDYIDISENKVKSKNGVRDYHHIRIKSDKALEGKEEAVKKYFKDINKNDSENSKLLEDKGEFQVFLEKVKYNMGTIIEDLNILLNS